MTTELLKSVWSLRSLERAWQVIEENARTSQSEDVIKEINLFREKASQRLRSLSSKLSRGSFRFQPARGIPIPKHGKDGKISKDNFRPIVLADVESRIVQRSILEVVLQIPLLQKYVHTPHSFGGIRKSSQTDMAAVPAAIKSVLECIAAGANFVICADIEKFFTRIPKSTVLQIVAEAVNDKEFMQLFARAIKVELVNMADLREKASKFPIYDIGVAQGNSLSPLLGNIFLYEFDRQMNEGDCNCLRYIDDIIILAPTKQAASSRLKKAEELLCEYRMNLSPEKSTKQAVSVTSSFEFLGIELSNGLIRPAKKAQKKIANVTRNALDESLKAFRQYRNGKRLKKGYSLVATLRRVDGIVQGWGKHYRFCNDGAAFEQLDIKISKMTRSYISAYSRTLVGTDDESRRILLGVELLGQIERRPLEWPKKKRKMEGEKSSVAATMASAQRSVPQEISSEWSP